MYEIIIKDKFDAAHSLPTHSGMCKNLHGHTWRVEMRLQFEKTNEDGMCIDFFKAKKTLNDHLPDHMNLNDIYTVPTAENIARALYEQLKKELPIKSITIWESENVGAMYAERSR